MDGHKHKLSMLRQVLNPNYVKEQRMETMNSSTNLGALSHELRTPLTAILGLASQLHQQTLTSQQRDCVESIYQQSNRLLRALNHLFKLPENYVTDSFEMDSLNLSTLNEEEADERLSILMVEDEPIIQRVHRAMLESIGYEVDTAANSEQALKLYKKKSYAAILMDINLTASSKSGIEITSEIRRLENGKSQTPIITLTANVTNEVKTACILAGANETVTKPINPAHLKRLLSSLIKS